MVVPVDEKYRTAIQETAEVALRIGYGLTVAEPVTAEDGAFKTAED